ncbi:hypothetical protein [Streptomyces sp. NPDC046862]|uniref:hypothetical protein n=1 Tax=Streptomyces sp. NPDC046862 TaxID=3154603 RepID=UPI003452EFA9
MKELAASGPRGCAMHLCGVILSNASFLDRDPVQPTPVGYAMPMAAKRHGVGPHDEAVPSSRYCRTRPLCRGGNVIEPMAGTDRFLCQDVFARDCRGMMALGQSEFTRGSRTPEEWVRLSFSLYSFRSERIARELYTALNLGGTKLALPRSGGDEHVATRRKDGEATVLSIKARAGTTVMWVFAVGSEQTASSERAEKALQLLYKRTQQAKSGAQPTASISIP